MARRIYVLENLHGAHDVECPVAFAFQQVFGRRVLVFQQRLVTAEARILGRMFLCNSDIRSSRIDAESLCTQSCQRLVSTSTGSSTMKSTRHVRTPLKTALHRILRRERACP
jgi:hypothetical protein